MESWRRQADKWRGERDAANALLTVFERRLATAARRITGDERLYGDWELSRKDLAAHLRGETPPTPADTTTSERELWREYANLLCDASQSPISLAWAHGWRCPDELIQRGNELRVALGIQPSQERHADLPTDATTKG
jgi:hypothetical protein